MSNRSTYFDRHEAYILDRIRDMNQYVTVEHDDLLTDKAYFLIGDIAHRMCYDHVYVTSTMTSNGYTMSIIFSECCDPDHTLEAIEELEHQINNLKFVESARVAHHEFSERAHVRVKPKSIKL